MEQPQTIGYKDVNPFFQHITWLLEEEAKTKWKYNDIGNMLNTQLLTAQLIHLEDWYMTLETLYDRIIGKLTDEDKTEIDALFSIVDAITHSDNFSTSNLSTRDIIDIRNVCRVISRQLNELLWKHKIHIDVKPTKIQGMIW